MFMEKIKGHINERAPATAYAGGRAIRLAALVCPQCAHELRAHDVELLGDGDLRIVCGCCHVDTFAVEKQ